MAVALASSLAPGRTLDDVMALLGAEEALTPLRPLDPLPPMLMRRGARARISLRPMLIASRYRLPRDPL